MIEKVVKYTNMWRVILQESEATHLKLRIRIVCGDYYPFFRFTV